MTFGARPAGPVGSEHGVRSRSAGQSLVEVLVAAGLVAGLASISTPALLAGRDNYRAHHAARYLATVIRDTRARAIASGHQVAIRFTDAAEASSWVSYEDGNRNGVRTADVTRGVDRALAPATRLTDIAPGVQFGINAGTVDIDTGAELSGDGVRTGAGNWISFTPSGVASSGTLYLRGPGGRQFAVRVLGGTGRVRVLRYERERREWVVP